MKMQEGYADRSRVLTHQSCPRRRWFEYEVPTSGKVNGIRPGRLDMNLIVGSSRTIGTVLNMYHDTSTFGGDLWYAGMASPTGTFTGNYWRFYNAGVLKSFMDSTGECLSFTFINMPVS